MQFGTTSYFDLKEGGVGTISARLEKWPHGCLSFVSLATPAVRSEASVERTTLASTTVVSARTLSKRTTLAATALARSDSLSWVTVFYPQGLVIFMCVVGCGTASVYRMRQSRRHARESVTSTLGSQKPSR